MAIRGFSLDLVIRNVFYLGILLKENAYFCGGVWLGLIRTLASVVAVAVIRLRLNERFACRLLVILNQLDGNLMSACGPILRLVKGVFDWSLLIFLLMSPSVFQELSFVVI